jgi:hypothetical protein
MGSANTASTSRATDASRARFVRETLQSLAVGLSKRALEIEAVSTDIGEEGIKPDGSDAALDSSA